MWLREMCGSKALAERNARTSPVRVSRIIRARTSATPCSLSMSRLILRMTGASLSRMSASASRHEHGDHVQATLLVELALPRNGSVEDGHLHELAVRRARAAGAVDDRRHAPVEGRIGDRAISFRRCAGLQGRAGPVGQRERLQPFEPLLGEEGGRGLTLAELHAARGVLESGCDPHQADREDQCRHEDLTQAEASFAACRAAVCEASHRTLTRPVAATTTVRVALSAACVSV